MIAVNLDRVTVAYGLEPVFDKERDKSFYLDIDKAKALLKAGPFLPQGRVDNWFTSDAFGLKHARSLEAEKAIEDAKTVQLKANPTKEKVQQVHDRLVKYLGDFDTFWPRWLYFAEKYGVET